MWEKMCSFGMCLRPEALRRMACSLEVLFQHVLSEGLRFQIKVSPRNSAEGSVRNGAVHKRSLHIVVNP